MPMKRLVIVVLSLLPLLGCVQATQAEKGSKPRTIITTDGEVDDMDSFIRMLLYSNELNIEGLVYSSSQWHYKGDGKGTLFTSEMPMTARLYGERTGLRWPGTTWMQELIGKYAEVYDNLTIHDASYPSPQYLASIIRTGNIDFEGDMKEPSGGSDFIKDILLDDREGPVYVLIWGGTNTLARALLSIEETYKGTGNWDEVYRKVSDKTFIYTILDQDATYTNYVAPNWPDVRVIYNSSQFWSLAYMWPRVVPEELKPYMEGPWFAEHIKFNHGPLLENYYLWGDGTHIEGDPDHTHGDMQETVNRNRKQYDFISEGDSPSYFHLLDFGLRSLEDPTYGGLGGRFRQSETNPRRWEDGRDVGDINPETGEPDPSYPQVRWIEVLQNDFAARADWCVQALENANHPPEVTLRTPANIKVNPGETVELRGTASDPDGDQLSYHWWQYVEAGTCEIPLTIEDADSPQAYLTIPEEVQPGRTIHLIMEVKDKGSPRLTRFARTILTIE
jgi:hypothetical protein